LELRERAKREDETNREEIEAAAAVSKDHMDVCRNWAAAYFAIASAILVLTELLLTP